jgi:lipoprotein signal peptidase
LALPRTGRLAAFAGALVILDQAIKALVRAQVPPGVRVALVGKAVGIVQARNYRGVSWFVPDLPGWGHVLLTASLVATLLLALPLHRFHAVRTGGSVSATLAAVFLTASTAGHLSDGLFAPFTTDWLQVLGPWACNLADLCAYAGLTFLAAELLRLRGLSRGLGVRERCAATIQVHRDFMRFLSKGMRVE